MSTYSELVKQLHKRAKLADQYMRRLEKLSTEDKRYKSVLQFAYSRARYDIENWSGKGAKRWDVKAPRTVQGVRAKLSDIERFLSSPTATKRGITKIYEKRAKTMNEKYGTDADWEKMAKYYSRSINEKFDARFGSKTSLLAVGKIQQNARNIKKKMNSTDLDKFIVTEFGEESKPVRRAIKKMIKQYFEELKEAGIL